MDQNSLEKLNRIVSSAVEFGKNQGIVELSEEVERKLERYYEAKAKEKIYIKE